MKCPKCEKEYNQLNFIGSNTYICPFCGVSFNQNGYIREGIKQILKNLVDLYGITILKDVNRTNALLMDYAPHLDKERKLIIMVMREQIVPRLMKIANESEYNQKLGLNKCVRQLIESIWITEIAAKYAVVILASVIGIDVCFDTDEQISMELKNISRMQIGKNNSIKILTKEDGILSEDAIYCKLKECNFIGYKALAANINIEHLVLPENIKKIYPKAFFNCINLCSITLPRNIENIGMCAFEGCSLLKKIEILDGLNYTVVDGMLIDKVNKKVLRVENDNSKSTIKIVNNVSTICKKAFDYSPAKCISIPNSINMIEENAFFFTQSLERFEVASNNRNYRAIDGVLHNQTASLLVKYPQGRKDIAYYLEDTVEEIGIQAFSFVQNLQNVTFTGNLKRIGNKAFEYCISIENILLSENIEIIGDKAFQYCESMRSILLSRNMKEIGDCAFYNCVSLETINIPRSVKKIGNFAFANCKKLKTIMIQDNISFIGDGAFVGCEKVEIFIRNNLYVETYCHSRGIKFSNI